MLIFRTFTEDPMADKIIDKFLNGRVLELTEREIDAYIDLGGPAFYGKDRLEILSELIFDEAFAGHLAMSGLFPYGYPERACVECFLNFRLLLFDEEPMAPNMIMNYLMYHLIDKWKGVYEFEKKNVQMIPDMEDRVLGAFLQIAKREALIKFGDPDRMKIVNLARGYMLYFEDLCNYTDICFFNHDFKILDQVNLNVLSGVLEGEKKSSCEDGCGDDCDGDCDHHKGDDTIKWYS